VDDEEALVRLGSEMLAGLGYTVTGKQGALEALEAFRLHPEQFDLVVTDMTMPHLTGIELAQEILRLRPGTPIILCTGFSDQFSQERIQALGLRELVMKPILIGPLARAIRRHLD
jgi:CheY-like chemotaxis protein